MVLAAPSASKQAFKISIESARSMGQVPLKAVADLAALPAAETLRQHTIGPINRGLSIGASGIKDTT
jgi:hypothetical protein